VSGRAPERKKRTGRPAGAVSQSMHVPSEPSGGARVRVRQRNRPARASTPCQGPGGEGDGAGPAPHESRGRERERLREPELLRACAHLARRTRDGRRVGLVWEALAVAACPARRDARTQPKPPPRHPASFSALNCCLPRSCAWRPAGTEALLALAS
jgi:hypothetical protein